MASPTGSTWRNTIVGPEWGEISRRLTLLLAAVESHESSYEPTNFTTLTTKLAEALDALDDAETAAQAGSNDGYPA